MDPLTILLIVLGGLAYLAGAAWVLLVSAPYRNDEAPAWCLWVDAAAWPAFLLRDLARWAIGRLRRGPKPAGAIDTNHREEILRAARQAVDIETPRLPKAHGECQPGGEVTIFFPEPIARALRHRDLQRCRHCTRNPQ